MQVLQPPPIQAVTSGQTQVVLREFPSDKLGLSLTFCQSQIYQAICNCDPQHTLRRIKRGDNVNVTCERTGNTLVHVIMVEANPVVETKYVPFVYQLSNANADLDLVNNNGYNPLRLAIKMHLLELMIALIKCGAKCDIDSDIELIISCSGPVEYEFRSAYQKFAPGYWTPVTEDKAFKVNVLVKSWSRINVTKQGKTLIEFAKESGAQDKIVKMLMDNESSIEFAHATIAGDLDRMVNLMQHYSVDMDTKDFSHKENFFEPYCPLTLYGAAVKYGHKHVLHVLKGRQLDASLKPNKVSSESHSSAVCVLL